MRIRSTRFSKMNFMCFYVNKLRFSSINKYFETSRKYDGSYENNTLRRKILKHLNRKV